MINLFNHNIYLIYILKYHTNNEIKKVMNIGKKINK